jgi:GntR family transcriptional repressor for pyruvate dehydrogenase complex
VVAEHLAAAVRAGEFAAGEKLPPERVLAERFGVSRNVVREAANELRTRGLLVTRQGSGSVISNHFHKPVSDLLEDAVNGRADGEWRLLELRSALEIDVARLAAERATRQEIEGLECVLNTYDRAGEDLEACAALDVAFHRTLAQVAHNDLFGLVLASLDELLVKARRLALERSGIACASRSHREILEAVKSRRPGSAAKAMERHLSMTRENLARSRGAAKRGKEKSKS